MPQLQREACSEMYWFSTIVLTKMSHSLKALWLTLIRRMHIVLLDIDTKFDNAANELKQGPSMQLY